MASEGFGLALFGRRISSSFCILTRLLVIEVDLFIILLIISFHLVFKIFALGSVIFGNFWTVPIDVSEFLVFTQIPQLENVLLSVAASQQSCTISSEINGITAYMRAIPAGGWSLLSNIIDLHSVVPSSRGQYVGVVGIPLDAKDSVRMPAVKASFFHPEHNALSVLVVQTDVLVFTCSRKQVAL